MYKCLNKEIESVEVPNTVTDIEANAFENCKKLKNITFNNGLIRIGYRAFSNCESIEKLDFPDSLTTIDTAAFLGCTSLKEIDSSRKLDVVGDYAFLNCNNLAYIYSKNSINNISNYALIGCNKSIKIQVTDEAVSNMMSKKEELIDIALKIRTISDNSGSTIIAFQDSNKEFTQVIEPNKNVSKKEVSNEDVLKKLTPNKGYGVQTFDSSNILAWSVISLISTYLLIKKRYSNICDK